MLLSRLFTRKSLTLIVMVALTNAAPASDADDVADFNPASDALYNCAREYVRGSSAPTVGGAVARCNTQFERYLRAVTTMTRLSTPRMGGPTPEWEAEVKARVAQDQVKVRDAFAKWVKDFVAEK